MTPLPRTPHLLLILAVFLGLLTVTTAGVGLWWADPPQDWDAWSRLVFYAVAIIAFEQPDGLEPNLASILARPLAVLFSLTTATGLLLELSQLVSDALLRFGGWIGGRRPAILFGLGWIGGPLAATLRAARRPVYAIAIDEHSPRVAEARRMGVVVVAGDATDRRTRARVPLARALEVFVATGDDALNIELAGNLLEVSRTWRRRDPLRCYVHITDPTFAETLGWQQIWSYDSKQLRLVPFSYQELAARDLLFRADHGIVADPTLLPSGNEPFHLVIIGFGFMGQTVARHVARFAHFGSRLRPRLTVLDEESDEFEAFLQRYPAFSPTDLDLSGPAFRAPGADDWARAAGRPESRRHRVADEAPGAVEYAVNAEFAALPADLAAEPLSELVLQRATPLSDGTKVRMAVVVCLEEERVSFEAALRLQHALAAAVVDLPEGERPERVPMYVYLPVERGLATVLELTDQAAWLSEAHKTRDRSFPVRVFGERDVVASHSRITAEVEHKHARQSSELYRLLAPLRASRDHLDFASSNLDAVLHAQVKSATLGIAFANAKQRLPAGATPVLAPLFVRGVESALTRLYRKHPRGVPRDDLQGLDAAVRQRVVLQGHVEPRPETQRPEHEDELVAGVLEEVFALFSEELAKWGHDPDLPAAMEHNRWMGERLLKGWRFGERDDLRRQRQSMVPWVRLDDRNRRHDRVSLPRFIVEAHREGLVAYWGA